MIRKKSKKASGVVDIYIIFIFLFISTFVVALALYTLNAFNTEFQKVDAIPTGAKASSDGFNTLFRNIADGAIIFWLAILWLGSLASAFFLDNSPIFFVIFLLLSFVSFFILLPFANMQNELSQNAILEDTYDLLPMSMFVNNNMVYFLGAYILSVGLALYVKFRVVI
jgi:hypothetical protein